MDNDTAIRLLEALSHDRLIVLCGAGLSRAAPSALPSAEHVANQCAMRYIEAVGCAVPEECLGSLEALAKYFRSSNRLDLFLRDLVPWSLLRGRPPNAGHRALADLLACRAIPGACTANFDALVEAAASGLGEPDFRAVVDAGDITQRTAHSPYLKLHGCEVRCREATVWCPEQLSDSPIRERTQMFEAWLKTNLLHRDLIFVGFWSDWAYLTKQVAESLSDVMPGHVYLVDPASSDVLRQKAPELWEWSHSKSTQFHHCQESAADFLDELRVRWSAAFVDRLVRDAEPTYRSLFGTQSQAPESSYSGADTLYALRRDLTGTPATAPVRASRPEAIDHVAAAVHQRLLALGAVYSSHRYELNGRSLRVVSGRGRVLSQVRRLYQSEPPAQRDVDQTICAGAIPDATPMHIVRDADESNIIRSGASGSWATQLDL